MWLDWELNSGWISGSRVKRATDCSLQPGRFTVSSYKFMDTFSGNSVLPLSIVLPLSTRVNS